MFISKDAALGDSGEFVSLLSDPVKWPLFLPSQGVTPASAQRLTCQRLSGLFQSHQTQVLGHFLFSVPGTLECLKMLTFRERPREA